MATVTVNSGGSTQVTVITGEGSTTYSVSTGARGPAGTGGGGGVTNLATGTGLTGGPITTTGTIALANTAVTAGVYQAPFIQVDAQGRLTKALDEPCSDEIHFSGVASLNAGILTATEVVEFDTTIVSAVARTGIFAGIATSTNIFLVDTYTFSSTAAVNDFLQVTGGGFTHTFNVVKSEIIVQSSTEIITRLTGSVTNSSGTALPTRPAIGIFRKTSSSATFTLTLKVQKEFLYTGTSPVVVTGRAISLAATTSAGTYATPSSITVDATGRVTAATAGAVGPGTGTVTSITAGTGLSGGTITTTGTIALANTAVTAAAYTNADITVDAQGRITAAANGSAAGSVTGTAPIVVTSGVVSLSTTLPSAYAFTSTTRPTSSGTGTPAATSLLKRDDVDRRYLSALRSINLNLWTSWTSTVTTGGSVTGNVGFLEIRGGNGSAAGAALAKFDNTRLYCGVAPTGSFSGIDFGNKVNANFAFVTRNWADFTSLNWAFIFGECESAAFTGIADRIKTGTNSGIGWVGLRCVAGSVTIVAVNGTSTVRESAQIDTCLNSTVNTKGYRLEISGGIITVFNSLGIVLGTLGTGASDGAPTTSKGLIVQPMVQSSVTTNQIGIIVQHISFDW